MKLFLCLLLIILSTSAWSTPSHLQIWFLSAPQVSWIKNNPNLFALNSNQRICQKMGEYCFDPQIGLYKPGNDLPEAEIPDDIADTSLEKTVSAKSLEREKVVCEQGHFFDIYCGHAQEEKEKKSKWAVYIDISDSMKVVDPEENGFCARRIFAEKLKSIAGQEGVDIYHFNITLTKTFDTSVLCRANGLNDEDRLIKWIEEAEYENVVVITDISELTMKMVSLVSLNKGILKGDSVAKPLTKKDLIETAKSIKALKEL